MSDDHKPEPPRRRLPRQLPPPLTRPPGGPLLPHAAVLDELLSPVGVLLWQLLQDATLWSTAERTEREGLFADAARATRGAVPEVEEELDALAVLVRDPHPDAGPVVARMCDRVRAWAEDRGLYGTALAFAQAGALADPECARAAYEVGRLARCRAEYSRAEVWYQRALGLAKRSGEKEVQALGLSGLANMHSHRGSFGAARKLKEQVVRLARRHSLDDVLRVAYHDIAVLDFETGEISDGMRHARRALASCGPYHEKTAPIIHDMAVALMDRCGAFAISLEVFRVLVPRFPAGRARILALANLARAAAGSGNEELFDAAWTDVCPFLQGFDDVWSTDALIALARGAAVLGQRDRCRWAAAEALRRAQARREGKSIHLAETVLGEINSQEAAEVRCRPVANAVNSQITAFAAEMIQILRKQGPCWDDLLSHLDTALSDPGNPRQAYEFARTLRNAAEYARAIAWFEHGRKLAQRTGDGVIEVLCVAGLGNLHLRRGNATLAAQFHRERLELAQRKGLRDQEGCALAELCSLCLMQGARDDGFTYARNALAILGPGHALVPLLAQDLAMYLMDACGDFENALFIFQTLQRCTLEPEVRLVVQASLTRAAAGAGHAQLFEETMTAVWEELERFPDSEWHSGALIQLAQAALLRGHNEIAERAARWALDVATRRGEAGVSHDAEGLVQASVAASARSRRKLAVEYPEHDVRTATRLSRTVVAALGSCAAEGGWAAQTPHL